MSTRAVYSFKDTNDTFHVYKHYDGYPEGAAKWIHAALEYAWKLPRFEAAEFACAFITSNKITHGDLHLTKSYKDHGDLDFRYVIFIENNVLHVEAFSMPNNKIIFSGSLTDFIENAETIGKSENDK